MSEEVGASTGSFPVLQLSEEALSFIVEKKATCPFVGTAVATGCLPVRNDVSRPLAAIEEVRRLGDTGGGDLGEILIVFASGNHAKMPGPTDEFNQDVPDGLFSLDFPGSQGSHPGHSGILQGDPRQLSSGRFSQPNFDRLVGLAKDGYIKRSDVARFIARNLHEDKNSKVLGLEVAKLLSSDFIQVVKGIGTTLKAKLTDSDDAAQRELEEKLTKLTGENNLVGSCGEFGLLFAFLANSPSAKEVEGEPALRLDDLQLMFVQKRFPEGWESWKKTRLDWVRNTFALAEEAGKELLRL